MEGTMGSVPDAKIDILSDTLVREATAQVLAKRGGELRPEAYYDPAHPRVAYPGHRPVKCP
jgi:hypothetical protein